MLAGDMLLFWSFLVLKRLDFDKVRVRVRLDMIRRTHSISSFNLHRIKKKGEKDIHIFNAFRKWPSVTEQHKTPATKCVLTQKSVFHSENFSQIFVPRAIWLPLRVCLPGNLDWCEGWPVYMSRHVGTQVVPLSPPHSHTCCFPTPRCCHRLPSRS